MSLEMSPYLAEEFSSLYKSSQWKTLVKLKDELFASWINASPSSSSEWSFISEGLKREGRMEGLMIFLKEIEERALRE